MLALLCCNNANSSKKVNSNSFSPTKLSSRELLFDTLLADGFSFPFGDGAGGGSYIDSDKKKHDGWYIATATAEKYDLGIHTGEDWNGNGGGNTDLGQPVYATAKGIVLEAKDFGAPWGNVVYMEHHYIENGKHLLVYSLYAHLNELLVKKNQIISKRSKIGTIGTGHNTFPAHLHFEMRKPSMKDYEVTYWPSSHDKSKEWVLENYFKPSDFVKEHKKCFIPAKEEVLMVAVKSDYKMYLYKNGKLSKTLDIALSQSPVGHKVKQGDNKMPEGEYKITEKNRGPFGGNYAAYFGPAWMRISYPNCFDAAIALKSKLITQKQHDVIVNSTNKGIQPSSATPLGGGIGIHGWAGDWPTSTKHLTWGCISMQNKDLDRFYELIPVGTRIVILA